mmetsp:Transcript_17856/g.40197  ORF Transcript_17856/g.40197 Transcript_17856/m.40197 type:complete len:204 (+) Transcript_17856:516-1127(+)
MGQANTAGFKELRAFLFLLPAEVQKFLGSLRALFGRRVAELNHLELVHNRVRVGGNLKIGQSGRVQRWLGLDGDESQLSSAHAGTGRLQSIAQLGLSWRRFHHQLFAQLLLLANLGTQQSYFARRTVEGWAEAIPNRLDRLLHDQVVFPVGLLASVLELVDLQQLHLDHDLRAWRHAQASVALLSSGVVLAASQLHAGWGPHG